MVSRFERGLEFTGRSEALWPGAGGELWQVARGSGTFWTANRGELLGHYLDEYGGGPGAYILRVDATRFEPTTFSRDVITPGEFFAPASIFADRVLQTTPGMTRLPRDF